LAYNQEFEFILIVGQGKRIQTLIMGQGERIQTLIMGQGERIQTLIIGQGIRSPLAHNHEFEYILLGP
jgi:hypothetical protein